MIGDVSDVKVFGNVLSYHFDVQALSIMDIHGELTQASAN